MTTKSAATVPALRHVTALVAANAEERHVLLRRAVLIRHGETEWTVNGRHTGSTDIPLTDNGRDAARQLAPLAAQARFSLVLTSPMRRARETCELAGLDNQAEIDANLLEWNYGEYEGLTAQEIYARQPGWRVFTHGCPGGESPADVAARVDRVIARIRSVGGRCRAVRARPRVQGLRRAMARPAACGRQPLPARSGHGERAEPLPGHSGGEVLERAAGVLPVNGFRALGLGLGLGLGGGVGFGKRHEHC